MSSQNLNITVHHTLPGVVVVVVVVVVEVVGRDTLQLSTAIKLAQKRDRSLKVTKMANTSVIFPIFFKIEVDQQQNKSKVDTAFEVTQNRSANISGEIPEFSIVIKIKKIFVVLKYEG